MRRYTAILEIGCGERCDILCIPSPSATNDEIGEAVAKEAFEMFDHHNNWKTPSPVIISVIDENSTSIGRYEAHRIEKPRYKAKKIDYPSMKRGG